MTAQKQSFSVKVVGDYVHLKTWGSLDVDDLEAPANAALTLAKEQHIDKLLDDIKDIDSSGVSIRIQTKAMGILWKLRSFKRVAIVMEGSRIRNLFFSTLAALQLNHTSQFKGFDNETDAIAWLKEE